MGKKKHVESKINNKLTAVVQMLFTVAMTAQVANVTTPVLLASATVAGSVIGTDRRSTRSSGRP